MFLGGHVDVLDVPVWHVPGLLIDYEVTLPPLGPHLVCLSLGLSLTTQHNVKAFDSIGEKSVVLDR